MSMNRCPFCRKEFPKSFGSGVVAHLRTCDERNDNRAVG